MKNTITVCVRAFPVTIRDERTDEASNDTLVLTRQQLQAAQIVGESSTELICRLYNRQGFRVLDIGKPIKMTIPIELNVTGQSVYIGGSANLEEVKA